MAFVRLLQLQPELEHLETVGHQLGPSYLRETDIPNLRSLGSTFSVASAILPGRPSLKTLDLSYLPDHYKTVIWERLKSHSARVTHLRVGVQRDAAPLRTLERIADCFPNLEHLCYSVQGDVHPETVCVVLFLQV